MSGTPIFDAVTRQRKFWNDMSNRAADLVRRAAEAEREADELLLDVTRVGMRYDGQLRPRLGYITLDCRDGVHGGCEVCDCRCHS
jgi:hypothetical protein